MEKHQFEVGRYEDSIYEEIRNQMFMYAFEMKALKCKPSAQFAYNYSINVLSKCSNIISHRSSIIENRHIDLRRSTHRSSKVDIDLQRSTLRSPKGDIDLRKSTHQSSKIEGGNIAPTIRHRILSTTALHSIIPYGIISDEVTHAHTYIRQQQHRV